MSDESSERCNRRIAVPRRLAAEVRRRSGRPQGCKDGQEHITEPPDDIGHEQPTCIAVVLGESVWEERPEEYPGPDRADQLGTAD